MRPTGDDRFENLDHGACPLCGGDVWPRLRSGIGLAGEGINWSESGVCLSCRTKLRRPIGPASSRMTRMTPEGPWCRGEDDGDEV